MSEIECRGCRPALRRTHPRALRRESLSRGCIVAQVQDQDLDVCRMGIVHVLCVQLAAIVAAVSQLRVSDVQFTLQNFSAVVRRLRRRD